MAGDSRIVAERERSLQAEPATTLVQLCAERDELCADNTELRTQNSKLRAQNTELQEELCALRQSASPQRTVSHLPTNCAQCGAALSAADIVGEPQRRQVFELPPPPPLEVTEHQAQACRCGQCGSVTRAVFPAGVNAPAQYGERLAATAVYLQNTQLLPEQRLAEVFADLFGVKLCSASLAGMTRKAAQRWQACTEQIRDLLLREVVRCL